jgi:hypothetical protein
LSLFIFVFQSTTRHVVQKNRINNQLIPPIKSLKNGPLTESTTRLLCHASAHLFFSFARSLVCHLRAPISAHENDTNESFYGQATTAIGTSAPENLTQAFLLENLAQDHLTVKGDHLTFGISSLGTTRPLGNTHIEENPTSKKRPHL